MFPLLSASQLSAWPQLTAAAARIDALSEQVAVEAENATSLVVYRDGRVIHMQGTCLAIAAPPATKIKVAAVPDALAGALLCWACASPLIMQSLNQHVLSTLHSARTILHAPVSLTPVFSNASTPSPFFLGNGNLPKLFSGAKSTDLAVIEKVLGKHLDLLKLTAKLLSYQEHIDSIVKLANVSNAARDLNSILLDTLFSYVRATSENEYAFLLECLTPASTRPRMVRRAVIQLPVWASTATAHLSPLALATGALLLIHHQKAHYHFLSALTGPSFVLSALSISKSQLIPTLTPPLTEKVLETAYTFMADGLDVSEAVITAACIG